MPVAQRMRAKLRPYGWWIGAGLGLACLVLAVRGADLRAVGHTLARTRITWVGLALLVSLAGFVLSALRWQILLRKRSAPPVSELLGVLFVAQLLNGVLPGRSGIAARAYLAGRHGPGVAFTLGSVVVEKVLESVSLLPAVVLLLTLAPVPAAMQRSALLLAGILAALILMVLAISRYRKLVAQWLLRVLGRRAILQGAEDGIDGLSTLLDRSITVRATFLSLVIWGLAALSYGLVLLALDLDVPALASSLLLLAVLQLGVRIPTSPGSIGVFHYLAVFTLGRFGVPRELGLSYGILLHAVVFLVPSLLGGLYLLSSRLRSRQSRAEVGQSAADGEVHGVALRES